MPAKVYPLEYDDQGMTVEMIEIHPLHCDSEEIRLKFVMLKRDDPVFYE